MPLNAPGLTSGLASLFSDSPAQAGGCAEQWASAVQAWVAGIVPPSAAVSGAVATLQGALGAAFATPDCAPAMESAFAAFAVTVGGGMAGFAPTPPAGPVGFVALFAGAKPANHADAASAIATKIDTWMKTGFSTLLVPPFTVTPWT